MRNFKGWLGEKKAAFYMWLVLDGTNYVRFHSMIIPSSNGTAQMDHIVVSPFGIFIIETKNRGGWIYGGKRQANWTQTFYSKKFPFQNPLKQVYRHKKVLANFLNIDDSLIHTVVYFVGRCELKTDLPSSVIKKGLGKFLKSFKKEIISKDDQTRLVKILQQHKKESSISKQEHAHSLKQRHSSTTVCPNCGSILKLRLAKKGQSKGELFLGCEEFPKCRFSKSA